MWPTQRGFRWLGTDAADLSGFGSGVPFDFAQGRLLRDAVPSQRGLPGVGNARLLSGVPPGPNWCRVPRIPTNRTTKRVRGAPDWSPIHSLNHLNAKDAASAAAQDGFFQFRFDRLAQDGRVGLFLPSQGTFALVGRGESFFDQRACAGLRSVNDPNGAGFLVVFVFLYPCARRLNRGEKSRVARPLISRERAMKWVPHSSRSLRRVGAMPHAAPV